MKAQTKPIQKPIQNKSEPKHKRHIAVKCILVAVSFAQAHWVTVAFAAGAVVSATMFGDKAYLADINKEAERYLAQNKSQDAVNYIEDKIAEYDRWRGHEKNIECISSAGQALNDLYFQLARAKEAANYNNTDVTDAYKRAVASPTHGGEAFQWLCNHTPDMKYQEVFRTIYEDADDDKHDLYTITQGFIKSNNWDAFSYFLDIMFEHAPEPVSTADIIETGLAKNSRTWGKQFIEYCRSIPELKNYLYQADCQEAEELDMMREFKKAELAFKYINDTYATTDEQKAEIEFKICRCLYHSGDYNAAISAISRFLEHSKIQSRTLTIDALLLQGKCHIQQGEIEKAVNEFLTLTIEYPEAHKSPEAGFFIGYCYMLQRKFSQAKDVFSQISKDYPQSSFSGKACSCLARIESMTE